MIVWYIRFFFSDTVSRKNISDGLRENREATGYHDQGEHIIFLLLLFLWRLNPSEERKETEINAVKRNGIFDRAKIQRIERE